MITALIVIFVILYLMFGVGMTILITYLDVTKWNYDLGDNAIYIILGFLWPIILICLFFRYVLAVPFIKFGQFLDFLSDKFDEIKEERRKRGE